MWPLVTVTIFSRVEPADWSTAPMMLLSRRTMAVFFFVLIATLISLNAFAATPFDID